MKIRPLNDWVVLNPSEAEERTAGGIIIPESAKEKPMQGTVIAAGPGAFKEEKGKGKEKKKKQFIATVVKAGDEVLYQKYMASELELEGEKITMVREEYILGVFGECGSTSTALQKKGSTALEHSKKPEQKS